MENITPELIAKAKAAKSAEELYELAKANNVELTEEDAKVCFEQLHTNGAVSDDELDVVAGGCFFFNSTKAPVKTTTVSGNSFRLKINKCSKCGATTGFSMFNVQYSGTENYTCDRCKMLVNDDDPNGDKYTIQTL